MDLNSAFLHWNWISYKENNTEYNRIFGAPLASLFPWVLRGAFISHARLSHAEIRNYVQSSSFTNHLYNSATLAKYATTGLVYAAQLNKFQKIPDLLLFTEVVVASPNAVISRCYFAEDGTDFFIRAFRTCSTIIPHYSTNQILHLWRCRCRGRRRCWRV